MCTEKLQTYKWLYAIYLVYCCINTLHHHDICHNKEASICRFLLKNSRLYLDFTSFTTNVKKNSYIHDSLKMESSLC